MFVPPIVNVLCKSINEHFCKFCFSSSIQRLCIQHGQQSLEHICRLAVNMNSRHLKSALGDWEICTERLMRKGKT